MLTFWSICVALGYGEIITLLSQWLSQQHPHRIRELSKGSQHTPGRISGTVCACLCLLFGQNVLHLDRVKLSPCWVYGWVSKIQANSEGSTMDLSMHLYVFQALFVLVCVYFLAKMCCTRIEWNYHIAESIAESGTFIELRELSSGSQHTPRRTVCACLCLLFGQYVLHLDRVKWSYCSVNGWVSNIQTNSDSSAMELSIDLDVF